MEYERRDLLARAARERLAELTAVHPRQLAGLDAMTAGQMARAILYPKGTTAALRRARPGFSRSRRHWALAALAPVLLLLLIAGALLGGSLRTRLTSSSTAVAAPRPTARPAAPQATAASVRPAPSNQDAVLQPALRSLETRTGLAYAAGGCGGKRCLSAAQLTMGDGAAYVRVAVAGDAAADTCLAYLHRDAAAWSTDAIACGRGEAFAPVAGASERVQAPGACARLRSSPAITGAVRTCLPNSAPVTLTGPPLYRDGHTWWPVTWERVSGYVAMDAFALG